MAHFKLAFAAALALSAAHLVALSGASPAAAQGAPTIEQRQGVLTAVWGDPHPGSGAAGDLQFKLTAPDGTRTRLDVPAELQGDAIRAAGKTVTVRGGLTGTPEAPRLRADAFEGAALDVQPAVSGTRKVLFILLRFKGDDQKPHPTTFFSKLTNPKKPPGEIPATINGFFDKVSYGALKWSGTVAGDKWYTLPKPRTGYAPCGADSACADVDAIGDDALALVKNDVDVNQFDNINFVVNDDLDCCAWGGSYSNGSRSWGATWEPPWGQETSTYVHEMGHSLGLPHSGWRYYAYDSGHDEMSRGSPAQYVACGTYDSTLFGGPNTTIYCTEPGGGYIMAHQDYLGWVPAARKATVSSVSTKTYTIEANSLPLGDKLKVVVVCLAGASCSSSSSSGHFLTIEVKLHAGKYDNGVPSEGVVIHDVLMNRSPVSGLCYFNPQSGWAMPFDAVPGDWNASTCSGTALQNLAYKVGSKFNDSGLGVKVEVLKQVGDAFKVRVTKSK